MNYTNYSFVFENVNLTSTAKLVYCILQSYKKDDNICYLTAQQLADLVGCHRNSVTRALDDLEVYYAVKQIFTMSIKNRPQYIYRVHNWAEANDLSAYEDIDQQMQNPQKFSYDEEE